MKKVSIVKIIFTACRQPDIVEHNIVGWLFNPTMMPLEKAFEYVRKYNNFSEDTKLFIYHTDAEIIETNVDEDNSDREIKMSNIYIGPGESKYILITQSNLESMYPIDLDGDTIRVSNVEEIVTGDPDLWPYWMSYTGRGAYNIRNKWLQPMKHYAFDRDQLTKLFNDHIASNEKAFETLEDAIAGTDDHEVGDFRCWKDSDEEFYILHVPSGTIVGWYKFYHFGRDNFSNRDMTLDDLKDFFNLLRNQLLDEPDVPDEPRHPQVKVTEVDNSKVEKTLKKADVEKTVTRLTINSIYGAHGLDPVSMYPMPPKSVDMENAWNVVKQWAKEHFHLSETNHIKCTVTSKSGKDNVWLIRHHDFIQLMGDTGDEIFIGYMRAEYSHKDEYGRRTCIQDQIRFENPIINKFYQDFFANGPVREEYDFYKKTAGGW